MLKIIKKYWYIFPIIILLIICIKKEKCNIINTNEYINKIDSLQTEINNISILKDSIDQKIDTVTITIEKIHIEYEKDYNNIINNNTSEDYMFFLNYIRNNKSRLDSINNF